jgi:hypothetical protein
MQETYAKYISSASANANLTIARWNILVNNQDIVNNSNFTDTIVPTFAGTSNIRSGVIAPTAEGYFDITINGDNTDVSFSYSVTVSNANSNTVDDLIITKYVIDNVEYQYNGAITNSILLNAVNRSVSIRFYVKWNDDVATQTMDNDADTAETVNGVAAVRVDVNVIQLQ